MSMYFLRTPDTYSYISRLKTVRIATNHRVAVTLKGGDPDPSVIGNMTIFTGVYEPIEGDLGSVVEIDFTDIIRGFFDIDLPSRTPCYPQEKWHSEFSVTVSDPDENDSDITSGFSVCSKRYSSLSSYNPQYNSNEKGVFQTKQPFTKHITLETVELLTVACLVEDVDDVAITAINGVACNHSLIGETQLDTYVKAHIFDVSPRMVEAIREAEYNGGIARDGISGTTDIPSEDASLGGLPALESYVITLHTAYTDKSRTYIIDQSTGREKYFAFVNSYGGIDTLIMQGDNVLEPETEYPVADYGGKLVQRNDDDTDRRIWHQYSGRFDRAWKEVLNDFAETRQKYWKIENYSFVPIVVTECSRSFADRDNLVSFDFKYKRTGEYQQGWRIVL